MCAPCSKRKTRAAPVIADLLKEYNPGVVRDPAAMTIGCATVVSAFIICYQPLLNKFFSLAEENGLKNK